MVRILLVGQCEPGPLEGGGPRRTHQLWHELCEHFGMDNTSFADASHYVAPNIVPSGRLKRIIRSCIRGRLSPQKSKTVAEDVHSSLVNSYKEKVRSFQPDVVVLETRRVRHLVNVNMEFGIKSILAPWSLEALTDNLTELASAFNAGNNSGHEQRVRSAFSQLVDDMMFCAGLSDTWMLSKLESAFMMAAGVTNSYVPYYPVGEAVQALFKIRNRRTPDGRTFLISGGSNPQNTMALKSFLSKLNRSDVPRGTRITIVGLKELPEEWHVHLGDVVDFRGRLPSEAFNDLLTRTSVAIIPQVCGFGCMTRVADLLSSGIPVLASSIVGNAMGEVPGLTLVRGDWREALIASMDETFNDWRSFDEWYNKQRNIVRSTLDSIP